MQFQIAARKRIRVSELVHSTVAVVVIIIIIRRQKKPITTHKELLSILFIQISVKTHVRAYPLTHYYHTRTEPRNQEAF